MLRKPGLGASIPPVAPKPSYEFPKVKTFWGIPLFASAENIRVQRQSQTEGSPCGGDELPVGRQQVKEGRGGDPQKWPSEMGTERAIPGVQYQPTQHHH